MPVTIPRVNYSETRCEYGVSRFDQQGGHVRAVFEIYSRDVASEGGYSTFHSK
jgi:hypothetical protein